MLIQNKLTCWRCMTWASLCGSYSGGREGRYTSCFCKVSSSNHTANTPNNLWESRQLRFNKWLKAAVTWQTTGLSVFVLVEHQWPTWPALYVTEERWGKEVEACQGCHQPGCLIKACLVGELWGPDWQYGGSQTPPVSFVSGFWAEWPVKKPERTFGRYIHLQPAW